LPGPQEASGIPQVDPAERPIKKSHFLFGPRPLFGGSGFDTILTPRGRILKRRMSPLVVMAAAGVIPLLVMEEQFTGSTAVFWLQIMDWAIWGVFAAELAIMLTVTPDRRAYLRCAWLDVCIVLFTVPLLPYLLASLRLARLGRVVLVLRLLRLLRLAAVANRAAALIQRVFGTSGLGWLMSGLIVLVVVSGTLFSYLEEGRNVPEGIWWAIVTATTVGYGDVVPASGLGRLVATVLMIAGISFIALLSAATAARLVELETEEGHEELLAGIRGQSNREQEMRDELREMNERLARLEEMLSNGAGAGPKRACAPYSRPAWRTRTDLPPPSSKVPRTSTVSPAFSTCVIASRLSPVTAGLPPGGRSTRTMPWVASIVSHTVVLSSVQAKRCQGVTSPLQQSQISGSPRTRRVKVSSLRSDSTL